jgi:hypothetical protein
VRAEDVLRAVSFGGDVAEYEADLSTYFVRTDAFAAIVADRHDLVLGAKGTGKSAIFQILTEPDVEIPELTGTITISAFELDAANVLRRLLVQYADLPEPAFRTLWKSYVASLLGNYLVVNDMAGPGLLSALRDADLLAPELKQDGMWRSMLDRVGRVFRGTGLNGELEVTPGVLPGVKAKIGVERAARQRTPEEALLALDDSAQAVLHAGVEVLAAAGISCWICFDRLDEVFADDVRLEQVALRALLRTHSDLRSLTPRFRLKLFLRNDVLERVTKSSGFVNLTHLRSLDLRWSRRQISAVVADRVWRSPEFREFYRARDGVPDGRPGATEVLRTVLPPRMSYYTKDVKDGFVWAVDQMTDGTKLINPRNVLTLMQECQRDQLDVFTSGDKRGRPGGHHLISGDTLKRAAVAVGRKRIVDTLFAEHNLLRAVIEKFRYGKRVYTLRQLVTLLGQDPRDDRTAEVVQMLGEAGFLQRSGPDQWIVAPLYAAALDIVIGGSVRSGPETPPTR